MKFFFSGVLIFLCAFVNAQPATDIYLLDLKLKGKNISVSNPINISNRKGYDNQPFFHPTKPVIYYVSADSTGETDIMIYDFKSKKTSQLTSTPDREYSPTVTPDQNFISCIIQRSNGAQDLGRYPIEGGEAEVLINNLTVGYHAWATGDELAIFALPAPFTLHIINRSMNNDMVLTDSIGRSLHKVPGEKAVSFVEKGSNANIIKKWNVEKQEMITLGETIPCQECDMSWTPDGKIIMSDGKKLFLYTPGKKQLWKEIKTDDDFPKGAITRMAVGADGLRIAVVVGE